MGKIVNRYDDLASISQNERLSGKLIALTLGTFDLLHEGHYEHFRVCREIIGKECILVVGVRSDYMVKIMKGKNRPIDNEEKRLEKVAAIEGVDYVCIYDEQGKEGIIGVGILRILKPDYYLIAPDCKMLDERIAFCETSGINLLTPGRIPPDGVTEISTTLLISQMRKK